MANEITDKFDASAAMTITLASLANGSGRQSTLIDNTANKYQDVLVYVKIKNGASGVTPSSFVEVYLIRGDDDATTEHISDGGGASDAAITLLNAAMIGSVRNGTSPNGTTIYGEFHVHRPGPTWGIAVLNRTGAALDSTGSNHWARYVGLNSEIQ